MIYPNQIYDDALSELKKTQEEWFEKAAKSEVSYWIKQGYDEHKVLQQFKVTFDEKEHSVRFLLKEDLESCGYSVELIKESSKSVYVITISKENQY